MPFQLETVIESLEDYTATESLDGDNKYDAGELGLQPAEKGVMFVSFPPVLHLQLLRFQFEFPELLNVSAFVENRETNEPIEFVLHAVLVHSGDMGSGHYVVFINTNISGPSKWCKFDDDVVSCVSTNEAVEANYGGAPDETSSGASTNAYMLVYIKKTQIEDVLCPVTEEDIPAHLLRRFEAEKLSYAEKTKEEINAHLHTELMVILEEHMFTHDGFDLFDPNTLDDVLHLKVKKKATISELYSLFAKEFCIDENAFRLWQVQESAIRDDSSDAFSLSRLRPSSFLKRQGEEGNISTVENVFANPERNIVFVEVALGPNHPAAPLPAYDESRDLMIFLKYYDIDRQEMFFTGHITISCELTVSHYMSEILEKAHLPLGTRLNFYQEVSPENIRLVCSEAVLSDEGTLVELADSAILIFEKAHKSNRENNARAYFIRKYNTLLAEAVQNPDAFDNPPSDHFIPVKGEISLTWSMEQLTKWIANGIGCAAERILLWKMSAFCGRPTRSHLNAREMKVWTVKELLMLNGRNRHDPRQRKQHTVYYTHMPFPVAELKHRYEITVFPHKNGTVQSILSEAQKEFRFSQNGTKILRLVHTGVASHVLRVYEVFDNDLPVVEVFLRTDSSTCAVRVEEVPEEEVKVGDDEYLIPVAHFDKDPSRTFGVPFYIKVTDGETHESISGRIRKKLEVSDREFDKVRTPSVTVQSLKSEKLLRWPALPRAMSLPWLGLDHMNKTRSSHTIEQAIVIHN
ncbi:unnamed protein product [Toxocara canis]|uniref:ubiquitinyl hydrolase 1 n=1 Tax=Toxocara canis TaxID=6265 RepID=A0A183UTX7_TOXCA|nr:unnamed protein product [Toxocara canis]